MWETVLTTTEFVCIALFLLLLWKLGNEPKAREHQRGSQGNPDESSGSRAYAHNDPQEG